MNKLSLESRLFFALLALLVWLPLPFGSNRPWAEALFELVVVGLALSYLFAWQRGVVRVGAGFVAAQPMAALFAVHFSTFAA